MASINLHYGDSLPAMRQLPDNAFDLAIVDPPYGIDGNCSRKGRHKGKLAYLTKQYHPALWKQEIPPQEYFDQLFRISRHQIIWGINYFLSARELKTGPGRIIWDKCNGSTSYSDCEIAYCSQIESVRLFRYMWNGMMQGKSVNEGHLKRGNTRENEIRIHPTQKPVALYKWLLGNYAQPRWKIIDTHAGSFSIGIACHDLDFDLEAWELDPVYGDDALKRYENHVSQLQLFK